ncbi:phosphatase PAP2 family protein [Luteibacter aegosomatis]|uniref:phosphatase PAP2 family protein n=1 Tax=Luteibacter aegosomatis TaxID=2911537 RepID=UPI001FF8CFF4|nr:phosphatase PAP2 family protein [Luteibacter aegosomatis]UPG87763.1 phosphatase PAP2 family protein [Luteibacter aegosomatis]
MTTWRLVTALGDSALLLPLIAWLAVCLAWIDRRPRDALRWLAAAIACGGVVALSKLLFMGWGIGPPGLDYTGFSGHTALSLLVWTSMGALLVRGRWRGAAIVAGLLVGIGVAISRLALEVHSVSEVLLGALAGSLSAAWFIGGTPASPDVSPSRPWTMAVGVMAIGLLCYGRVFPSQHLLQDVAKALSGHGHVFVRHASR